MRIIFSRSAIPATLLLLIAVVIALVISVPEETTLGRAIRPVFLHGALVQTGLVIFAAAAVAGAAALITGRAAAYRISEAGQWTATIVWIAYTLSSMVATYLAWGVIIAWYEPRVQASAKVLAASVLFLVITRMVGDTRLAAIANCAMGILAWVLIKGSLVLQHPLNPIGTSDSAIYKALFAVLWITLVAISAQVWRQLASPRMRELARARTCSEKHPAS